MFRYFQLNKNRLYLDKVYLILFQKNENFFHSQVELYE
nr:MAG TPA: hypothetical protein [Caudoviricetes sp.]